MKNWKLQAQFWQHKIVLEALLEIPHFTQTRIFWGTEHYVEHMMTWPRTPVTISNLLFSIKVMWNS